MTSAKTNPRQSLYPLQGFSIYVPLLWGRMNRRHPPTSHNSFFISLLGGRMTLVTPTPVTHLIRARGPLFYITSWRQIYFSDTLLPVAPLLFLYPFSEENWHRLHQTPVTPLTHSRSRSRGESDFDGTHTTHKPIHSLPRFQPPPPFFIFLHVVSIKSSVIHLKV